MPPQIQFLASFPFWIPWWSFLLRPYLAASPQLWDLPLWPQSYMAVQDLTTSPSSRKRKDISCGTTCFQMVCLFLFKLDRIMCLDLYQSCTGNFDTRQLMSASGIGDRQTTCQRMEALPHLRTAFGETWGLMAVLGRQQINVYCYPCSSLWTQRT